MSPKKHSHPIPPLTNGQSNCIYSDSVVYSIGREEDGMPANLKINRNDKFFARKTQYSWSVNFCFQTLLFSFFKYSPQKLGKTTSYCAKLLKLVDFFSWVLLTNFNILTIVRIVKRNLILFKTFVDTVYLRNSVRHFL